jgi:hypothetical protein
MQSQVFLTYQQEGELVYNTTIHTAMFFGLCAMIWKYCSYLIT